MSVMALDGESVTTPEAGDVNVLRTHVVREGTIIPKHLQDHNGRKSVTS